MQDLSCSDYAVLVESYHGSAAAAANCTGGLKRVVVAQHQYAVPLGPAPLVVNNPTFVGAQHPVTLALSRTSVSAQAVCDGCQ